MVSTRQLVLADKGRIEVDRAELGPVPDDHVLVRAHQASICGTDLSFYRGRVPKAGPLNADDLAESTYPYRIGHEGGGEVVEVGSNVTDLKPGDFVISCHHSATM